MRAAIGLVQLRRLERGNEEARRIVRRYREELDGVAGISVPFRSRSADEVSAHHLAVLVLPDPDLREPLREFLKGRGIQTSVHYPPIHRFSAYSHPAARPLPVTDTVGERLVTLPLYPHLRDDQVELVIRAVREHLAGTHAIAVGAR